MTPESGTPESGTPESGTPESGTTGIDHDESIRRTYFGLRTGMFALAALLFAAIVVQWLNLRCWQSSISAYYYTPVAPVLVAALCAIGTCLVVYQGTTAFENGVLNVAGFLAAIVAFVPTEFRRDPDGCRLIRSDSKDAPTFDVLNAMILRENQAAIGTSVLALVVAGLVALIATRVHRVAGGTPSARWSSAAVAVLLLIVTVSFLFARDAFLAHAHMTAAILFFVCILLVMAHNAVTVGRDRGPYKVLYWALFGVSVVLILALAVVRLAQPDFRMAVFWMETVGVAGFTAFWLVQTIELGGDVRRPA